MTWTQDGETALQTLQTQPLPDLIILDLHLPGMSGKDILTTIQQTARFASVKIVIATADRAQAKELEKSVNSILLKPIAYEQLTQLCEPSFIC